MELITIQLPEYAVRYLVDMCQRERHALAYAEYREQCPPSLQMLAAYDALNQIESALPTCPPTT
jgi:hypothetical protein